jgi:hypothetical protein
MAAVFLVLTKKKIPTPGSSPPGRLYQYLLVLVMLETYAEIIL